jgi:hypothetical protein
MFLPGSCESHEDRKEAFPFICPEPARSAATRLSARRRSTRSEVQSLGGGCLLRRQRRLLRRLLAGNETGDGSSPVRHDTCLSPVAASFQLAVYTRNTTSCRFLLADLRRLVLNRPSRPDLLYDSRGGKFSTCRMRPQAPEDGILWPRPKVSQLMSSGTCRSICCAKCDGNKSPAGADPLEKPDAEQ